MDPFNKRFGHPVDDGTYQLAPLWQSGLQCAMQVGQMSGLFLTGSLTDCIGYKRTLIGALLMSMASVFLFYYCQNIRMLLAAEFVAGIPWGAFEALANTYAADISPMPLRPILTTWINANWAIGQLIAIGVLCETSERTDEKAYRIPWAIQWLWPGNSTRQKMRCCADSRLQFLFS